MNIIDELYNSQNSLGTKFFTKLEIKKLLSAWVEGHPGIDATQRNADEFGKFLSYANQVRLNESLLYMILSGKSIVTGFDENGDWITQEKKS